jgi:glycosyltransferase involved in cell wall biosynthesis
MLLAQQRRILASSLPAIYGVSRYTCRTLTEEGAQNVNCLPIPTDLDRFTPPAQPAPPGVIGFAARLGDPRKRVPLLLKAVAELGRRGLAVRLRLAGDWPTDLPTRVDRMGLSDRIELLGVIPDHLLPDFYRSLDVFALPSSQEGLGIVGIEAMACGVPVVAAAQGYGPDDYVIDGVTGWFATGSAKALADRLALIITDRDKRHAMSAAARALAVEHFSHNAFTQKFAQAWMARWGDTP